jgi:hypothetical protein
LPAIHNYYWRTDGPGLACGSDFDWLDATGGTSYSLSDDGTASVDLPNGRSFTFYGQAYTRLFVSSNGMVTFGQANTSWSGAIPDPRAPNNGIYAFSADMDPAEGAQGHIYTAYLNNRYFVIEWHQVQHFRTGNPETFEIVLDLDTNQIKLQYQTVNDPSGVVAGVENADGTEATQYADGDPALIASGAAVTFYPFFDTPPPSGGPGHLHGTISDMDSGDPIAGATVTVWTSAGSEIETYTTGPDGVYSDTLCADLYDLMAKALDYVGSRARQVPVSSSGPAVRDFALGLREAAVYLPLIVKNGP